MSNRRSRRWQKEKIKPDYYFMDTKKKSKRVYKPFDLKALTEELNRIDLRKAQGEPMEEYENLFKRKRDGEDSSSDSDDEVSKKIKLADLLKRKRDDDEATDSDNEECFVPENIPKKVKLAGSRKKRTRRTRKRTRRTRY